MDEKTLKVGDIARRTGVSVRTLHYYEELGLLAPGRMRSGHRFYQAHDLARLQQIKSLQHLGIPLGEVRDFLARPDASPREVIRLHLARARERLALAKKLCRRLEAIDASLATGREVSQEAFLETIEVMTMMEKYYTAEQLETLRHRGEALGSDGMRKAETDWRDLIAEVRAAMERGEDPASAPVQALARRWQELVDAFTGGDPAMEASLTAFYRDQPDGAQRFGSDLDGAVFAFIGEAMGKGKK